MGQDRKINSNGKQWLERHKCSFSSDICSWGVVAFLQSTEQVNNKTIIIAATIKKPCPLGLFPKSCPGRGCVLPAPGAAALLGSDKETQPPALESALEIEREIELYKRNPSSLRLPPGLAGGSSSPLEKIESKFSAVFDGQRGQCAPQRVGQLCFHPTRWD